MERISGVGIVGVFFEYVSGAILSYSNKAYKQGRGLKQKQTLIYSWKRPYLLLLFFSIIILLLFKLST